MNPFSFATTPRFVFGAGSIEKLPEHAAALGPCILIVSDRGMVETGLVPQVAEILQHAGHAVAIFDGVVADPPESVIKEACAMAKACDATGVIGLGGGSSLDAAKLVSLLAGTPQELDAIYGIGLARGPRLPLLLAPTTAGTGSEVTPIAIVTTGAHEKKGVVSPLLLPDIALLDPKTTIGLPPAPTAATGVDAMVHAIESFTTASPNANPVSKALAREALRLLGGAIMRAVHKGDDLQARSDMLLGSMLAGQAFANAPVAAVHALAYPLGGHFGIPHGLSNALVLTQVMRFNASTCGDDYALLGGDIFPALAGESDPHAVIDAMTALSADLGLAPRLRDVGVPSEALETLADDAMKQTRLLVNNPREVTRADALAIYEAAW